MLRAYFIVALLLSAFAIVGLLRLAKADFIPENPPNAIYISARVEPATAPIKRVGNIYKLAGDINQPIVVQRDNIILDGAGFTLQGNGNHSGIEMSYRRNVTITNFFITSFSHGVFSYNCYNNTISGNTITENNSSGISLLGAGYCDISDNSVENNGDGIKIVSVQTGDSYIVNNIVRNNDGFGIYTHTNNILRGNIVKNNGVDFSLHEPDASYQAEPTPALPPLSIDSNFSFYTGLALMIIFVAALAGLLVYLEKRNRNSRRRNSADAKETVSKQNNQNKSSPSFFGVTIMGIKKGAERALHLNALTAIRSS